MAVTTYENRSRFTQRLQSRGSKNTTSGGRSVAPFSRVVHPPFHRFGIPVGHHGDDLLRVTHRASQLGRPHEHQLGAALYCDHRDSRLVNLTIMLALGSIITMGVLADTPIVTTPVPFSILLPVSLALTAIAPCSLPGSNPRADNMFTETHYGAWSSRWVAPVVCLILWIVRLAS